MLYIELKIDKNDHLYTYNRRRMATRQSIHRSDHNHSLQITFSTEYLEKCNSTLGSFNPLLPSRKSPGSDARGMNPMHPLELLNFRLPRPKHSSKWSHLLARPWHPSELLELRHLRLLTFQSASPELLILLHKR